jgi:peptide/nickel transport system ATP-binding protein/oligopeptide transport system ATP-binding protein
MDTTTPLLSVHNLQTHFFTEDGVVKAVDGLSFSIAPRETLCLVGESGCGKSITALSLLRLIPDPPGKIVDGTIIFNNKNLLEIPERDMRSIRGKDISMIFQEPMTALNPVFTIGFQIGEVLKTHLGLKGNDLRDRTIEMLKLTGIPAPEHRINEYPHQLSGGMMQRVMIAMALCCNPKLLIADEPTTALDVTIQAQILDLIVELQEKFHMAVLMITHDLGVVAETAHNVAVMYAGKIVEHAPVKELFRNPQHPYTIGLFESLPTVAGNQKKLKPIPGTLPDPHNFPEGCPFHPRCFLKQDICQKEVPPLELKADNHLAACLMRKKYVPQTEPK